MDTMQQYYERAFSESEQGNIYRPFSLLERLSHDRKMALLERLPLPDLSRAAVVDYGVGAWGFGCVFPRLKQCRHAIGIDISERAVELSRELTARDPQMRAETVEFRTSVGYELPLDDRSVDLFFAGECIEHIDDTEVFLTEVHRVLRPGGTAVFTTPNARPFVYRQLGLRWCAGFEHTALMDYEELHDRLSRFFHVEVALGFNQSLHPAVDANLDEATARAWVDTGELEPADATGLIVQVTRPDSRPLPRHRIETIESQQAVSVSEGARQVEVAPQCFATLLVPGHSLHFLNPKGAVRCSLILWSHPWSGTAAIRTTGVDLQLPLYGHIGGCWRTTVPCAPGETISIHALPARAPQSQGHEVIVLRAVYACV